MSEILNKIKNHLKVAMTQEVKLRKEGITSGEDFDLLICQKTVSRSIISMFPSIGKKPGDATDDDTIKLLRKYINQEKERSIYELGFLNEADVDGKNASQVKKLVGDTMEALGTKLTSNLIEIAQLYLPKQATEEEIKIWISENIDFSNYNNKMQAMGPIMKQFKGCDGNFMRNILLNIKD